MNLSITTGTDEDADNSSQRLITVHRRSQIAEIIQQNGSVRASELARRFGVSQVTIRNDFAHLERDGQLVRERGGALPTPVSRSMISSLIEFKARTQLRVEEKERIGKAAAQIVSPGDSLLLDAGTTVVEMVRHLVGVSSLTIVTNALNVATHIEAMTNAKLFVMGGTFDRDAASMLGPMAEQCLVDLRVSKLFLGAQAFDMEYGLTDTTLEIAGVKRAMIRSSHQVILLADSSKFKTSGFIRVAPFEQIHTIITDTGLDDEVRSELERVGVEIIVV